MQNPDYTVVIIYTTLIIVVLVGALLLNFFISGKRKTDQQMKLTQAKLDFEKELRQVETEVSEHLMGQFAEELHDNIGQLLTAMRIQIENQKLDHPELTVGLKPVEIYLDEVTQQLRLLSRTLNNDFVGRVGLVAAIELEIDRLKILKKFAVHSSLIKGSTNLSKNQELMVFRIFQEVVQNALKHSGANNFFISIENSFGNFILTLRDDGSGFDADKVLQSSKASGLKNIIKRSRLAGLDYKLTASGGIGCLHVFKKNSILQ